MMTRERPVIAPAPPCHCAKHKEPEKTAKDAVGRIDTPQRAKRLQVALYSRYIGRDSIRRVRSILRRRRRGLRRSGRELRSTPRTEPSPRLHCTSTCLTDHKTPPCLCPHFTTHAADWRFRCAKSALRLPGDYDNRRAFTRTSREDSVSPGRSKLYSAGVASAARLSRLAHLQSAWPCLG